MQRMGLDGGRSWIVGDRASDLEAGRAAALAGGVLVLTDKGGVSGNPPSDMAATATSLPRLPIWLKQLPT